MKERKGVLTVEAALVLPIFMYVMFFILSLMNLFYYHLVMQQALTNTGKTLVECGYVLDELGLLNAATLKEDTKETETAIKNDVQSVLDNAKLVINGISNLTINNIGTVIDNAEKFSESTDKLVGTIDGVKKEQVANYLIVSATNMAGGEVVKIMIGDYLKKMQVSENAVANLNYDLYVEDGTKDIIIVAEYTYELPFGLLKPLRLQQLVRVHPWIGGKTEGAKYN